MIFICENNYIQNRSHLADMNLHNILNVAVTKFDINIAKLSGNIKILKIQPISAVFSFYFLYIKLFSFISFVPQTSLTGAC